MTTAENKETGVSSQTVSINVAPSNALGITGFVLALLATFLGWIPVLGWILWALGLIFSFVGVFKTPRGLAIAGLVISFIDLILLVTLFGVILNLILAPNALNALS